MACKSKDPADRSRGRRVLTKSNRAGSTGAEYRPFSPNRNDNALPPADLVVITVGRLADRFDEWVALDNCSLIYAKKLTSHREAIVYAQHAAAKLAADGFRVTSDDCGAAE